MRHQRRVERADVVGAGLGLELGLGDAVEEEVDINGLLDGIAADYVANPRYNKALLAEAAEETGEGDGERQADDGSCHGDPETDGSTQ